MRPSALIALTALLFALLTGIAYAQDEGTPESFDENGEPIDQVEAAGDPQGGFDPDDIWRDQVRDEEQWAAAQQAIAMQAEGGDEDGVRDPPGLPMIDQAASDQPTDGSIPDHGAFNGDIVTDGAAPWQAQIFFPGIGRKWPSGTKPWILQHYCGGVLIAPNWVLTAAHCIDASMISPKMPVKYRVRLGAERIDQDGGWDYAIKRFYYYNPNRKPLKGDDIALIELDNDKGHLPPRAQVRSISLFRGSDAVPNEPVTAFGWGRVRDSGAATSARLMQVTLKILDRPTCQRARVALIDSRVVCANSEGSKTCTNDSGGPLINSRRQLVGIVSAGGTSCSADKVPGVYTRVAAYWDWINRTTGGAAR